MSSTAASLKMGIVGTGVGAEVVGALVVGFLLGSPDLTVGISVG